MSGGTHDSELVTQMSSRHGVSEDAVRTVLKALRAGGGTMAQLSHPAFGGMAQWSPGMTMVGDMFNDRMKATLDALASDLAAHVRETPDAPGGDSDVSYRSVSQPSASWWPESFGAPSSSGAQNNLRYAVFPDARRLAIEDGGKLSVYDTADHDIHGVAQAQGSDATLNFTSQNGLVRISDLKRLEHW
jgi:hypothetical protein